MELSSLNKEKLITPSHVMNNFDEINNFFMNNYKDLREAHETSFNEMEDSRVHIRWIFVKNIDRRSRHYPWIHGQNSGTTEWSFVWIIQVILKMLNQFAVDIPTFPVNLRFSHLIQILKEC